jgi:Zn-dependent peptidase ImmA (M78 family)/transcriptional regulator with XRE-family HTH domain
MTDQLKWQEIGARLRQARLAAGYSQEELGRLIGLEANKIAKTESGVRHLQALELTQLTAVLGVPMSYFLAQPPAVLSHRTELVDEQDTDAARDTFRLETELAAWLRDVRQLMELGTLPRTPPLRFGQPVRDADVARVAASWLRGHLGLSVDPLGTLVEVAERAGQFILATDIRGEGASLIDGDVAVAIVSTHADPARRRATAAHELGHMVLGDEYSTDLGVHSSREQREQVIDAFAAEFLIPAAVFHKVELTGPEDAIRRELIKLSAQYRVSWSLTLRQAVQAACIEDRMRTGYLMSRAPTRAEIMQAVGWAPQPDFESIRVPPSVANAVLTAVQQHRITPKRAAELTRGQIDEADLLSGLDVGGDADEW